MEKKLRVNLKMLVGPFKQIGMRVGCKLQVSNGTAHFKNCKQLFE